MWLMTTAGAYSAVCPRTNGGRGHEIETDKVMIRARVRPHLEALQERFPALADAEILETPHADYGYRLICDKTAWADAVRQMILDQEYPNFKDAVALEEGEEGSPYHHALHKVWAIMHKLQCRSIRPDSPGVNQDD